MNNSTQLRTVGNDIFKTVFKLYLRIVTKVNVTVTQALKQREKRSREEGEL